MFSLFMLLFPKHQIIIKTPKSASYILKNKLHPSKYKLHDSLFNKHFYDFMQNNMKVKLEKKIIPWGFIVINNSH